MSADRNESAFEGNVRRMLGVSLEMADDGFEDRLRRRVAFSVAAERRARRVHRLARWSAVAAVAAVLAAAVYLFRPGREGADAAATVTNIYGLVTIENGRPARTVDATAQVPVGKWLRTAWGSRARLVLGDESVFETGVNTMLKVERALPGAKVVLNEGTVRVKAAKQPPGRALTIETPAGDIKVVGTVLDVLAGRTPGGKKRTRVSVSSGLVEVTSAGGTLALPAGTVGIIDEGLPPVRLSRTRQVNDIISLMKRTDELAAGSSATAAYPLIIDDIGTDGSATVWLVRRLTNNTGKPLSRYSLSATGLISNVRAYSSGGWPLATRNLGGALEINLAENPLAPGESTEVILCVPGVEGLFEPAGGGVFSFAAEPDEEEVLRIVEFRLPQEATLRRVYPEPLAGQRAHGRLVVTVLCNMRYPSIFR